MYEAVREVQMQCIKMSGESEVSLEMMYMYMLRLIGKQLQSIKILPSDWNDNQLMKVSMTYTNEHTDVIPFN